MSMFQIGDGFGVHGGGMVGSQHCDLQGAVSTVLLPGCTCGLRSTSGIPTTLLMCCAQYTALELGGEVGGQVGR